MLDAGFQDLVSPQGAGHQLSAVLASSNPVVRMRAIALVIGLGGQSGKSVKALQQSGQCHFLHFHPMLHQTAEIVFSLTYCHQGCSLRQHILQHHDLAGQRLPVRGGYAICMSLPVPKVSACTAFDSNQFAHGLRILSTYTRSVSQLCTTCLCRGRQND